MEAKGMRTFNYSAIKNQKWDSEILGLIAAIYKEAGKQELYLKQRTDELEKLVEIAKIQSTEASNAIEGIVTTNTRIRQLVEEKTTPRNRDEQEIAGYRDVATDDYYRIPAIMQDCKTASACHGRTAGRGTATPMSVRRPCRTSTGSSRSGDGLDSPLTEIFPRYIPWSVPN